MLSYKKKIKTPTALKPYLAKAKRAGKKIIFTNGCFDILHKGHVTLLAKSKKQNEVLVVAINSDASVRRLKGKTRPINTLQDRMEVMAALGVVDFVTSFKEDDPRKLIQQLKPDVLVKGGDWKPSQILGAEEVKSWGGRVRIVKLVAGRSTTRVIAKAKRKSSV